MISNQENFDVISIKEFGLAEINGKENVIIKFNTNGGEYTWFGSLNNKLGEGKKMTGRDVTFGTMTKLGWNGDTDAFANGMPCFTLPDGVRIEVGDDEYAPGKLVKGKVLKIFVPGYGSGKMESGKAKSLLSGMKADIAKAQKEVSLQKNDPDF